MTPPPPVPEKAQRGRGERDDPGGQVGAEHVAVAVGELHQRQAGERGAGQREQRAQRQGDRPARRPPGRSQASG